MILQPFTRDPSMDDVHYRCRCKHYYSKHFKGIKLIKAWARNSEKLQEIIRD